MKVAGAGTAFEVPLYALLARVVPDDVLVPIALDVERAWLLLPDGGLSLGETEAGADAVIDAPRRSTGVCNGRSRRTPRSCWRWACTSAVRTPAVRARALPASATQYLGYLNSCAEVQVLIAARADDFVAASARSVVNVGPGGATPGRPAGHGRRTSTRLVASHDARPPKEPAPHPAGGPTPRTDPAGVRPWTPAGRTAVQPAGPPSTMSTDRTTSTP